MDETKRLIEAPPIIQDFQVNVRAQDCPIRGLWVDSENRLFSVGTEDLWLREWDWRGKLNQCVRLPFAEQEEELDTQSARARGIAHFAVHGKSGLVAYTFSFFREDEAFERVYVAESATGKLRGVLETSGSPLLGIAFSSNASQVVGLRADGVLVAWGIKGTKEWESPCYVEGFELQSCAASADGTLLALVHEDISSCLIEIRQMEDGELLDRILFPAEYSSPKIAFSPNGRFLACADGEFILFFEGKSGELLWKREMDSFVSELCFSPDEESLAVLSGELYLLDSVRGNILWNSQKPESNEVSSTLAFAADGQRIAVSHERSVFFHSRKTGRKLFRYPKIGEKYAVYNASCSPDGRFLAVGAERTISLFELDGKKQKKPIKLKGPHDELYDLNWGVGSQLYSFARNVVGYHLPSKGMQDIPLGFPSTEYNELYEESFTFERFLDVKGLPGDVIVALDRCGFYFSQSGDWEWLDSLRLWNATTGELLQTIWNGRGNFLSHPEFAISSDGKLVAVWEKEMGRVKVFHLEQTRLIKELYLSSQTLSVSFSPDGKTLATLDTSFLCLWEASTGRRLRRIPVRGTTCSFSCDGQHICIAEGEQQILLLELETLEERVFSTPHTKIHSILCLPQSRLLTFGATGKVYLWDLLDFLGEEVSLGARPETLQLEGTYDFLTELPSLSDVKEALVSYTQEDEPLVWRDALFAMEREHGLGIAHQVVTRYLIAETRKVRYQQRLATKINLGSVAMSPDGRWLAAGDAWGSLQVWDILSGLCVNTISEIEGGLSESKEPHCIRWSPDSQRVVVSYGKNMTGVWDPWSGQDAPKICVHPIDDVVRRAPFCWSPDGEQLALACWQQENLCVGMLQIAQRSEWYLDELHWFDKLNKSFFADSEAHNIFHDIAWLQEDVLLVFGRELRLFDLQTGEWFLEEPCTVQGWEMCDAVSWSQDGEWLCWQQERDMVLYQVSTRKIWERLSLDANGDEECFAFQMSADGSLVVIAYAQHTEIWDVQEKNCLFSIDILPDGVRSAHILGDQRLLAISDDNALLAIRTIEREVELWSLRGDEPKQIHVFSPLGDIQGLAFGGYDLEGHPSRLVGWGCYALVFWDLETGQSLTTRYNTFHEAPREQRTHEVPLVSFQTDWCILFGREPRLLQPGENQWQWITLLKNGLGVCPPEERASLKEQFVVVLDERLVWPLSWLEEAGFLELHDSWTEAIHSTRWPRDIPLQLQKHLVEGVIVPEPQEGFFQEEAEDEDTGLDSFYFPSRPSFHYVTETLWKSDEVTASVLAPHVGKVLLWSEIHEPGSYKIGTLVECEQDRCKLIEREGAHWRRTTWSHYHEIVWCGLARYIANLTFLPPRVHPSPLQDVKVGCYEQLYYQGMEVPTELLHMLIQELGGEVVTEFEDMELCIIGPAVDWTLSTSIELSELEALRPLAQEDLEFVHISMFECWCREAVLENPLLGLAALED